MSHTPGQMEIYGQLAADIRKLAHEAQEFGVDHRMLAVILLEMSNEMARDGGPLVYFDHTLWLKSKGKELLEAFERDYGDQLDFDELIKGRGGEKTTETIQ